MPTSKPMAPPTYLHPIPQQETFLMLPIEILCHALTISAKHFSLCIVFTHLSVFPSSYFLVPVTVEPDEERSSCVT